jgi:hypothetical protein
MGTRVKPAYDAPNFAAAFRSERDILLFFVLSKTLGLMLLPTNFLIGAGLAGAILRARDLRPLAASSRWRPSYCWQYADFRR